MPRKRYSNPSNQPDKRYAVIIAVDYDDNFTPVTNSCPSALLPVANKPILYHQIDHLESHHLAYHIFVYCKASFLKKMQAICRSYSKGYNGFMHIQARTISEVFTLGDVMRDIYSSSLIETDFLLFDCNSISNISFEEVLGNHRDAVKYNNKFVITRLYTERTVDVQYEEGSSAQTRITHDGQIIKHDVAATKVPINSLEDTHNIETWTCCVDTHVSICTPTVTSLFADNMDYDTFEDLIGGLIAHKEMQGYVARGEVRLTDYASSITTFKSLHTVSCAMMKRYADPINPDHGHSGAWRYDHLHHQNYYHSFESMNSLNRIPYCTIVDAGCQISPTVTLNYTVLGKFVQIGDDTTIEYCTIMDNAKIGRNCHMRNCYIAHGASILDGVTIEEGVVIGDAVVVGPNVVIPKNTRLNTAKEDTELASKDLVGSQCNAAVLQDYYWYGLHEIEQDARDEDSNSSFLGCIPEFPQDLEITNDAIARQRFEDEKKLEDFGTEVTAIIKSGFEEKIDINDVWTEVTSVRHTYMLPIDNVVYFVAKGAIELAQELKECSSEKSLIETTQLSFKRFMPIIKKLTIRKECRIEILKAIEDSVKLDENLLEVIPKLPIYLYNIDTAENKDVIDEEALFEWYYEILPENSMRKKMEAYIEYLEASDESSDEHN